MSDNETIWARLFFRDKGAKIGALLLATITWYVIQPAISFETTVTDVPIRVLVDSGWAVLEQSTGTVDVHFRGSREGIRYLSQEQLEVTADVRDMPYTNRLTIPLELPSVRSPAGVRPVFIRPSELTLTVDQEEDIQLPVSVHIQGNPPEGYQVQEINTTPAVVNVSGPRLRLEMIEAIRTTPIDLEGRLQSFKLRVGLVSPSQTWTARMDPERVEVEVVLEERSATKELEGLRVNTLFGSTVWPSVRLQPTHADVIVIGRADVLEEITAREVRLYVDLASLEPEVQHEVPIRVHVPPRVRLDKVSPATVQVSFGEIPPAGRDAEVSGVME